MKASTHQTGQSPLTQLRKIAFGGFIVFFLLVTTAAFHTAVSQDVKWHPGHYIFVQKSQLTKEMLTLPHFRGVQKVYTWRDFEPEMGRYDFSSLKADLALVKKYGRQLIVQFSYKHFFVKGGNGVPDYLTGEEYGGGVVASRYGGSHPVIWNSNVIARFEAMLTAFGREFDLDPNLEAVNLPETALGPPKELERLEKTPPAGVEPYSEHAYLVALKRQMYSLRHAFPNTVVIQYMNFPVTIINEVSDYAKEIGVGMGGPDIYPRDVNRLSDPETGVYRLYEKLAGTVPMGSAVQKENYSMAEKKQSAWGRAHLGAIVPGDEIPFPVREHLQMAQKTLKLNYVFWCIEPADCFGNAVKLLAEPDLAGDPAGGLDTKIPPKAFLK
jgi:hypothetical protein